MKSVPRKAMPSGEAGTMPLSVMIPAINAAGVLTFTPAANANGSATVTVTLSDGKAVKLDQAAFGDLRGLPNRADREKQHVDIAAFEQRRKDDDDEDVGQGVQDVDHAHHERVALAAHEARHRSVDHADGERTHAAGDLGDDRRGTGAGTATLARGDEHHVGALDHLFDLFAVALGSIATHFGITARTEAASEVSTDVELHVGIAHQQCLCVGVDGDELDTLESGVDHAVDGVDATATNADDLDDGEIVLGSSGHQRYLRWSMGRTMGNAERGITVLPASFT